MDHSAQHVPTFDEITEQDPQVKRKGENHSVDGNEAPHEDLSEEEEFDDVVDTFESVYNFRYEEPYAGHFSFFNRRLIYRSGMRGLSQLTLEVSYLLSVERKTLAK